MILRMIDRLTLRMGMALACRIVLGMTGVDGAVHNE